MNDFLDKDYEVPNRQGNYMRFQDGENRFRFLGSPILGWETWQTLQDGSRKPLRHTMDNAFKTTEIEDGDPKNIKHFWAAVVWNYSEEKVQILEITQKGIQKSLRALAKDTDWGSPLGYDIVVTKSGQKLDTEYQVTPKPAKKIDEGIVKLAKDMHINLSALYTGDDPFADQESASIADDAEKAGL